MRSNVSIAVASAKSFGDFVIAHSVLHRIQSHARNRTRLIACSHLKGLNSILPDDVPVTLVESGESRVPAVFDVKKCGAAAAIRSAVSLRRRFERVQRGGNELLAFDVLGVRERFIAGRWPTVAPRNRAANIYATYAQFLAEHEIPTMEAPAIYGRAARTVGVFPESRLARKKLNSATLTAILACLRRSGLEAKIFVLDGDRAPEGHFPEVVDIPRTFDSLTNAIKSCDAVISADSLPAHLAEYFARPVFVAKPAPNEYWLPRECFMHTRWGIFTDAENFSKSLSAFLLHLRDRETTG